MKKTNKIFALTAGALISSQVLVSPIFAMDGAIEVPIDNTIDYLKSVGFNPKCGTRSSQKDFERQLSTNDGEEKIKYELTPEEKKRIRTEEKVNNINSLLGSVADLWIRNKLDKPKKLLNKYENIQKVTVLEYDLVSIIASFIDKNNTQFIMELLNCITACMECQKYHQPNEFNLRFKNELEIDLTLEILSELKERLELLIELDNPRQNESTVNVFEPETLIDTPENLTMGNNARIIVMPCEMEIHDAIHEHIQISNELSQKYNILGVNIIDVLYQMCIYGGLENFSKGVSEYIRLNFSENCKCSDLLENLAQFVQENNFSINDILNSIELSSNLLDPYYKNVVIREDKSVEEYYKFNDFLRVILDNLK